MSHEDLLIRVRICASQYALAPHLTHCPQRIVVAQGLKKCFDCGERITPKVTEATTPMETCRPTAANGTRIRSSHVETRRYIIEEYIDQMLHKMRYK